MPEAHGNTFYVPQRIHLQLPATQEYPGGGVHTLSEGWHEGIEDERILNHPIVQRLRAQTEPEAERMREMAEMNRRRANGEATPREYDELVQEHARDAQEEQQEAADAWNERAMEAADRGVVFDEPHPNEEVQRARALTAQPAHVFSAAGFVQRPQGLEEDKKLREGLEPEAKVTQRQGRRGGRNDTERSGDPGQGQQTGDQQTGDQQGSRPVLRNQRTEDNE